MTYSQVVDWLFQQVPNYQHQGGVAYKPGLERIEALLHKMDDPHKDVPVIHIAGTNGKGSVSHILSAIFQEHGYKVGLFTSPHIVDFRERIKVNGEWIEEDFVIDFVEQFQPVFEEIQPSFFEITTAMAFMAFSNSKCDIAIIETGLGGRLDSTNIVDPEIAVITNIGIDHTAFLGNTLPAIAKEKAGIIKEGRPVIIGDAKDELRGLFSETARLRNASITFSADDQMKHRETDLLGAFQQRNIHTALTAVKILTEKWALSDEKVINALINITVKTNFKGRLQLVSTEPRIIVDAAHNVQGLENLLAELDKLKDNGFDYDQLRVVYGSANDKEWQKIIQFLPETAIYYFAQFDTKRSVTKKEFEKEASTTNLMFKSFGSVYEALNQCKTDAKANDLILACGSFYLLEKIN